MYDTDLKKIAVCPSKLQKGRSGPFAEKWLSILDTPNATKTFAAFSTNFETMFYPYDIKPTARLNLYRLAQKSRRLPGGGIDDGFQQFITEFQNLAAKSGITDQDTLIEHFSVGLDQNITTKIFSISLVPTTLKDWINKAKLFHTGALRAQNTLAFRR